MDKFSSINKSIDARNKQLLSEALRKLKSKETSPKDSNSGTKTAVANPVQEKANAGKHNMSLRYPSANSDVGSIFIDRQSIVPETKHGDYRNFSNIINSDGTYKQEYIDFVNSVTEEKFEALKKMHPEFFPENPQFSNDLATWKRRSLDKRYEHTHGMNNALFTESKIKPIGIPKPMIDTKIDVPKEPRDIPTGGSSETFVDKVKKINFLPLLAALRDKPDYRLGADFRRNSALLKERSSPLVSSRYQPYYSDYSAVAENTPKMAAAAAVRDDSTSAITASRIAKALSQAGFKEKMATDAQNTAQRNMMNNISLDVDKFNASQVARDNQMNMHVDSQRVHQLNKAAEADDIARTLASQANSQRLQSLINMLDARRKENEQKEQINQAIEDRVLHTPYKYDTDDRVSLLDLLRRKQ